MAGAVIATSLMRGLHLAATLSLLGAAGFIAWMLPAASGVPIALRQRLRRLCWISGFIALLTGAAWFVLQSAAIAGADTSPAVLRALPLVAGQTRYGNILMIRLGLLLVATLLAAGVPVSHRSSVGTQSPGTASPVQGGQT